MNQEEIRAVVLDILKRLAPEMEPARIVPDKPLRTQIDLDSMDWRNVMAAMHERLGVDIPESDYGKLQTLEGIVAYLVARATATSGDRPS